MHVVYCCGDWLFSLHHDVVSLLIYSSASNSVRSVTAGWMVYCIFVSHSWSYACYVLPCTAAEANDAGVYKSFHLIQPAVLSSAV